MKTHVLFDLDGTLANISHRLHFIEGPEKNWTSFFMACVDDDPITEGLMTLSAFRELGYHITIVSGRSDEVRKETESWIREQLGWLPNLIMRKAGDYRSDHELKREWINTGAIHKSRVLLAFEDRTRVVNMYREEGIPCYQVAPGDF